MSYINAEAVLPDELLREIQNYVQGEQLYIPRKEDQKLGWGMKNGSRSMIQKRNRQIRLLRKNGVSMDHISDQFGLSIDTIKKIIYMKTECAV